MARKRFDLRIIGFGLLTVLWSAQAAACINAPATDRRGREMQLEDRYVGDQFVAHLTGEQAYNDLLAHRDRVVADARRAPDFDHLTDLGALLILQGRQIEAVRLFVAMERLFPGRYQTASNLGTALELLGQDRTALRWIRIGVRRNSESHWRTEWLHARILEAKIALAADPKALDGRSIVGVTFENSLLPPLPAHYPPGNDGEPVLPWQLDNALHYQLRERLQFVKPKDPVVANLLNDWATLNLAGGPVETAAALYRLSWRYGAPKTPLSVAREREARRLAAQRGRVKSPAFDEPACPICIPW